MWPPCDKRSDSCKQLFYQYEKEIYDFIKKNERNLGPMPKQTNGKKFSSMARTLDRLAEKHGVGPEHVAANAKWLAGAGLEPDDIDESAIAEARALHRSIMGEIRQRAEILAD